MNTNEFKKNNTTTIAAEPKKGLIQKWHNLDLKFRKEDIPRVMPFMLFLTFWAIIYIANRHYGEKTVKEIDQIRRMIPDLKADYYTLNAELSNKSIQSEVVKMVAPLGLEELTSPPQRMKLIPDEKH